MTPLSDNLVFIPHTGFAGCRTLLDVFAQHLSNGFSVKDAAKEMGKDYAAGNAMMQVLRKNLGPQAV